MTSITLAFLNPTPRWAPYHSPYGSTSGVEVRTGADANVGTGVDDRAGADAGVRVAVEKGLGCGFVGIGVGVAL